MKARPQYANFGMPGVVEMFFVLLITVAPWLVLVWFIRYLLEMSRERRRLRLEVSKLAHELEGLRTEPNEAANRPDESSA